MASIIEFLEARIIEDEEAEASKFRYSNEKVTAAFGECSVETHGDGRVVVRPWDGTVPFSVDPAEFRALYADPAPDKRMLAECAAKRAIIRLDRCPSCSRVVKCSHQEQVIAALAAVYKDHPDYQQEWAA